MELGGVLFSRPVFLIWTLKEESLLLLLDTRLQLPPLCVCLQIGCLPPHPGIWLSSRNGVCWTEQFRAERPWQRGGRQLFWPEFHPPTGSEPTLLSFLLPTACPPTRLGQGRTHLHISKAQVAKIRNEPWDTSDVWSSGVPLFCVRF